MNRSIEFRVWCEDTDQWVDRERPAATIFDGKIELYDGTGPWHFQQYTGLKDKNGVKIFEGDILISPEGFVREVVWHGDDSAWRLKEKSGNVTMGFRGWVFQNSVIGNIFQNPELLNK